jgi:hypothetical protein
LDRLDNARITKEDTTKYNNEIYAMIKDLDNIIKKESSTIT